MSSGSESSVACAVAAAGAAGGGGGGAGGACSAQRAPVPTISVTPHSPGILDEPLQQLQRIHQAVQRMRHQAFTPQVYSLIDLLYKRNILTYLLCAFGDETFELQDKHSTYCEGVKIKGKSL